jgi:hypothetical protein
MRRIKISILALVVVFWLQAFAHESANGMHISTMSPQAPVFFD